MRTQVLCPVPFRHVTDLLYTCARVRPRARPRQHGGVMRVHLHTHTGATAPRGKNLRCRTHVPASVNPSVHVGRSIDFSVFLQERLSPASAPSSNVFKALPIGYTMFSLRLPRRAATVTPHLPLGSPRPHRVERLARGCIASAETRPAPRFLPPGSRLSS